MATMTTRDVCGAVARVTGESRGTIRRLGFQVLRRGAVELESDDERSMEDRCLDWDALEASRREG